MKRVTLLAMLAACISVSAYGGVVTVTPLPAGASYGIAEYANPLAGVIAEYDEENWRVSQPGSYFLELITSRSRKRETVSRLTSINPNWQAGDVAWVTFTTPQPIAVGTVITSQYVWRDSANDANNDYPMSYTLRLGSDGADTDWSDIAPTLSGPGARSTNRIQLQTLDQVGLYDSIRLDGATVPAPTQPHDITTCFVDFGQVIVLPERLEPIAVTGPAGLMDYDASSWASGATTFTFAGLAAGQTQRVDAIVIWCVDNGSQTFTIRDGLGNALVSVDMQLDASGGYVLPLQFANPLYTDAITLDFTAGGNILFEIMFLTAVPEPATMSLLALGGLALLRRRTRR